MNPSCSRCGDDLTGQVTMKVTMGKPDAEWADIMEWNLCPDCAGGIMVYIIDALALDYS